MVTADDFKHVMRRWAGTVTIVTTRSGEQIHGLTATAFASLSAAPPLVLVCVNRSARSHDLIEEGRVFCVNFLATDMVELSNRFAGRLPMEERFAGVAHRSEATGAPVLDEAIAFLDCRVTQVIAGGDHTIFIGLVEAASVKRPDELPLLYYHGKYHKLGDGI
jgi:flavin reductase (DIM6/NTAB) family NADH-FMN oxidoreductase RutF